MKAIATSTSASSVGKLLTVREKKTCVAAWFDRKTRVQIAETQGIAPQSVKKRLQRARRRLRAAGIAPPASPLAARRARPASTSVIENI